MNIATRLCSTITLLLLTGSYAQTQNLLQNPNAEDALVGGEIPDWVEVVGTNWTYRSTNPSPQNGSNYFFPGAGANGELSQDVDVSANSATIDTGTQLYAFSGYVRSFDQNPADDAQIIVEYRDAANTSVLDSFDSGAISNTSEWELVSDTSVAPSGTRFIRVRLISTRNNGTNNDGYFDNLSLEEAGLLPVELTTFTAIAEGMDVLLRWETASETNNAGFEIQHEGAHGFEPARFIEGAGTTSQPQEYAYRMEGMSPGRHAFRLKQIDFDGSFEFSHELEVTVEIPGTFVLSDIYPNPFDSEATFTLALAEPQNVMVAAYDVTGREVARLYEGRLGSNTHALSLSSDGLAEGVYFIRVAGDVFVASRKVVLLR